MSLWNSRGLCALCRRAEPAGTKWRNETIPVDLDAPLPAALAKLGPMPAELVYGEERRGDTLEVEAELVSATDATTYETRRADGSHGAFYRVRTERLEERSPRGNRTGSTAREAAIVAAIAAHDPGDRVSYSSIARQLDLANETGRSRDTVARWFRKDPARWARLVK